MATLRQQLFHILHRPTPTSSAARYVNYFLAFVILANCAAVALETVPVIGIPHHTLFAWLEAGSTGFFIIEYLLRLWVCVEQTRLTHPIGGRLRYALQPLPALDLLVIVTFWAPWDLRFLRIFRLTRLLRVLHLEELDHSFQSVAKAVSRRKHLLVISVFMMVITAYCFAALLVSQRGIDGGNWCGSGEW
jgi:voltage-gated potassium channel